MAISYVFCHDSGFAQVARQFVRIRREILLLRLLVLRTTDTVQGKTSFTILEPDSGSGHDKLFSVIVRLALL